MARRIRRNRRRPARKPRRRIPRGPKSTGSFTIIRRIPTAYLTGSNGAPGLPFWTGPASLLTLGTPVANPVYANIFAVPFAMSFSHEMLSQYTELVGIADRYKINSVSVKVLYSANSLMGGPSGGSGFSTIVPTLSWVKDSDDAQPMTVSQLQAKMGLKTKSLGNGKYISMKITPKVANPVYDGIVTAYSVPTKSQWINASSSSVPHYGVKGYFNNWDLADATQVTSCFTFDISLNVSLKDLQ